MLSTIYPSTKLAIPTATPSPLNENPQKNNITDQEDGNEDDEDDNDKEEGDVNDKQRTRAIIGSAVLIAVIATLALVDALLFGRAGGMEQDEETQHQAGGSGSDTHGTGGRQPTVRVSDSVEDESNTTATDIRNAAKKPRQRADEDDDEGWSGPVSTSGQDENAIKPRNPTRKR